MPKRVWKSVLILGAAGVLAGCPPKSSTDNRHLVMQPGASAEDAVWPFWPAKLQVHPSTRIVPGDSSNVSVIEARVRFTDADGAISRAVGQLTLQLHDLSAKTDIDKPVQVWNQDLRDLAVNRRQYDDVMQTYLFRLEVDRAVFPAQPELRAYFLGNDSRQLSDQLKVRPSPATP